MNIIQTSFHQLKDLICCFLIIIIVSKYSGDMWKFSLLHNAWEELRPLTKPAPRYGFVAGVFEDYWYITHGELLVALCP